MNTDTLLFIGIDLLAKSGGILLLAFAVQSLWRSASAAQRCLVWSAAFLVLLLLPLTLLVQPRWAFAWRKAPVVDSAPPVVAVQMTQDLPQATSDMVVPTPAPMLRERFSIRHLHLGLALWTLGGVAVAGWRMLGAWQVWRLRRQSAVLEETRARALITRIAAELGVRRHISSHASSRISVPLTWGAFRPVLLLPQKAAFWQREALEAALRHELGHIRHWDALSRLLSTFVCAAFWPNVLVWLAARAWRTAQEQACDDLVLRSGASTQDYAMQLLDSARELNAEAFRHSPAMAMARPSTLESRLTAIMDEARDRRPVGGRAWLAGASAAAVMLALCAVMQLRAEEKTYTGKTSPRLAQSPAVEVSVRLIEITSSTGTGLPEGVDLSEGDSLMVSKAQADELVDRLSKKKGVSSLSAPSVTSHSGQAAKIEISREFEVPDPAKDDNKVGVALTLIPWLEGKGVIRLSIEGRHSEFHGFREQPGSGKKEPVFHSSTFLSEVRFTDPDSTALVMVDVAPEQKDNGLRRSVLYVLCAKSVASGGHPLKNHASTTLKPDGSQAEKTAAIPAQVPAEGPVWSGAKAKAANIIIPRVMFRDATLAEALEFIRIRAKDLDPAKQGVNIVLVSPQTNPARLTMDLKDVPLSELLKYVTNLANLTCRYDAEAIILTSPVAEELYLKTYRMPAGFVPKTPGNEPLKVLNAREWLEAQGVSFPTGASAVLIKDPAALVVKNSQPELQKIEDIVDRVTRERGLGSTEGDLYLEGFQAWQLGEKLEEKGNKEGALVQYKKALETFQTVAKAYPNWQTNVVTFRLKRVAEAVGRIENAGAAAGAQTTGATAPASRTAMDRASGIILPHVEFRGATIDEALEFLRIKSRDEDNDPAKTGVNIISRIPHKGQPATITLSLVNVPLADAFRYVAELADARVIEHGNAVIFEPKSGPAPSSAPAKETPGSK